MRPHCRRLVTASIAVVLIGASRTVYAQAGAVATSPGLFEYHSAFWVNLHHLLYEQSRALEGLDTGRAIVRLALADTGGIDRLSPPDRRAWDVAIHYYRAHLASHDVLDRDMAAIKVALGDCESDPSLVRLRDGEARRAVTDSLMRVLEQAAPAYRATWWTVHDRTNHVWIAAVRPLVDAHGSAMASEIARIFHIAWSDFLIRVDASAYSSWAGAYTTKYPDRITVATRDSDYGGTSGLEMLFHESMHTLDDSVRSGLTAAAAREGKRLPPDFVHAMIFFTAGEVTRRQFPGYVSFAEAAGIWERGGFPRYLPSLRENWLPWIEGRSTFADAITRLAAALP